MRGLRLAALGVVATVTWPPAVSAAPAQVVRADRAFVAHASTYDIPFSEGERELSVTLVVPESAVGTAATGSVDLARPWAVVRETALSDGREVCSSAANVASFNEGGVAADGVRWGGAWVDVYCDDGNGYSFYRVKWESGPYWVVTHPVAAALMGGQVFSWSTPAVRGTLQVHPTANSPAVVTVCGHRTSGAVECFGSRTGYGTLLPSAQGLAAAATVMQFEGFS